ncbi:hypothetical protein RYX36_020963 [Vicia faba]
MVVTSHDFGDKIQASVRKSLLPRFENKSKEGSFYNFKSFGITANTRAFRTTKLQFKLNLQNGTIVTDVRTGMTTLSPYSIKLECTLFGPYVEALDAFLQFGCNGNVFVVSQYQKVKLYNGKVQIQNSMNSTKLLFNPKILEADNLKVRDNIGSPTQPFSYMKDASEMSLEEEFLKLSQRKTIEELKYCQDADEPTILPTVIGELVEQTMLFKIFVNNNVNFGFEQSFCVKKLCLDQDILAKFKNDVQNSGGVEDDLATSVIHNDINVVVVQDLGSKFENIVTEEKYGDNGSLSKLIEENVTEITSVKRGKMNLLMKMTEPSQEL